MVTYCVTKMVTTCSPMVGQFFDTMIVASSDKEDYNDPSKYKCRKLFRATLNGGIVRSWVLTNDLNSPVQVVLLSPKLTI